MGEVAQDLVGTSFYFVAEIGNVPMYITAIEDAGVISIILSTIFFNKIITDDVDLFRLMLLLLRHIHRFFVVGVTKCVCFVGHKLVVFCNCYSVSI